jgi:hypothetical protein
MTAKFLNMTARFRWIAKYPSKTTKNLIQASKTLKKLSINPHKTLKKLSKIPQITLKNPQKTSKKLKKQL